MVHGRRGRCRWRQRCGDGAGVGAGAGGGGGGRCRPAVGESPTDQSVERVVDLRRSLGLPRHG